MGKLLNIQFKKKNLKTLSYLAPQSTKTVPKFNHNDSFVFMLTYHAQCLTCIPILHKQITKWHIETLLI